MFNKKGKPYRRLPGKGRRRGFFSIFRTRCTLWSGHDHLLSVDNNGFSEDYKRFYFCDIQAIITQKTIRGKIWNTILALCAAGAVLIPYAFKEAGVPAFSIISGLFVLCFLTNWLRGPTCMCHILTAVQKEELPSLHRLRTAEKVIRKIRPLIEKIQGKLTSEQVYAHTLKARQGDSFDEPPKTLSAHARKPPRHYHGKAHEVLFLVLVLDGMLTSVAFYYSHILLTLLAFGVNIAVGISVIVALVKQHQSDMKQKLQGMVWTIFGYWCICMLISYIVYFGILVKNSAAMHNQWEYLKAASALAPHDSLFLLSVYTFTMACSFSFGVIGIMWLRNFRQEHSVPPPVMPGD